MVFLGLFGLKRQENQEKKASQIGILADTRMALCCPNTSVVEKRHFRYVFPNQRKRGLLPVV
jgi:hypothetical protein